MPAPEDIIITSIGDVYVGDYSGSDVLTQLSAVRTQGGRFKYGVKRTFEDAGGGAYRQVERAILTLTLSFYWDQEIYRLAMNTSLSTANLDDPTTGQKYVLLALMPNEDSKSSILIPCCQSVCEVDEPHLKTEGSIIPVTFEWQDRNSKKKLHRRGDYNKLGIEAPLIDPGPPEVYGPPGGLLGSRSPLI